MNLNCDYASSNRTNLWIWFHSWLSKYYHSISVWCMWVLVLYGVYIFSQKVMALDICSYRLNKYIKLDTSPGFEPAPRRYLCVCVCEFQVAIATSSTDKKEKKKNSGQLSIRFYLTPNHLLSQWNSWVLTNTSIKITTKCAKKLHILYIFII